MNFVFHLFFYSSIIIIIIMIIIIIIFLNETRADEGNGNQLECIHMSTVSE